MAVHNQIKTTAKLHELRWELLPHSPYSPDLAPSDFFLFADLKRMLAGKKFSTNEEAIAETEAFFEAKEESYYKNGIEKLYDRYNRVIALNTMLAYELISPTVRSTVYELLRLCCDICTF
jgi:[histone H3]-lysine36 N-dimethyltransferase SETMAR